MKNHHVFLDRFTAGFGVSLAVAFLLNTALVIAKGASSALFEWMKSLTGHHWITHSIFILAAFVVLGLVLSMEKIAQKIDVNELPVYIIISSVISLFFMAGFYLLH
jgi:hypothetical protein